MAAMAGAREVAIGREQSTADGGRGLLRTAVARIDVVVAAT